MIQTILGRIPSKSNRYRIGKKRLYKTDEVTNYERNFALQYKRHETIKGEFGFSAKVYLAHKLSDHDGIFKVIFDSLQKIGAIENDRFCGDIRSRRYYDSKNPRIEFELTKLPDD